MMGFNPNIAGMNNYYGQMGGMMGMGPRLSMQQMMQQMMQSMMQMMETMMGGGAMPMMSGMSGSSMHGFSPMLGGNIGNFLGTVPQGVDQDGGINQATEGTPPTETPDTEVPQQQVPQQQVPQQQVPQQQVPQQQVPQQQVPQQQVPQQQVPQQQVPQQQAQDTAVQGKKSGQKTGPPPGYKTMKGKIPPEVTAKAKSLLNQPMGAEIPFEANGKKYMARLETHYHPQGYVGGPNGYHKGVTVYEQA